MKSILAKIKGDSAGSILIRGSAGSFLVKIVATGLTLSLHLFLANLLGAMEFGIYIYVISWLAILVLLSKMGMDVVLLRFVASYRASEEWGLLRGVIKASIRTVIMASVAITGITFLVISMSGGYINRSLQITFLIGCLILPFMALVQVFQESIRSLKHVVLASIPEFVSRPIIVGVLLVLALYILCLPANAVTAMSVTLGAWITVAVMALFIFRGMLKRDTLDAPPESHLKEWFATALPLMATAGFIFVHQRASILIVGMTIGTTEAGILAVAINLSALIVWGLTAVNAIMAPLISQLYTKNKMDELQYILKIAAIGILVFTLLSASIIGVFGHWLLGLFGYEFRDGYTALLVLVGGQCVNSLAGSVGFLMLMTGHQKAAAVIVGLCAVVNILLNLILVPLFGLLGAAIASTVSIAAWNLVMYIFVIKRLKVDPTILSLLRKKQWSAPTSS